MIKLTLASFALVFGMSACGSLGEWLNEPVEEPLVGTVDPTPDTPVTNADQAASGVKTFGGYLGFGPLGDAVAALIIAAAGMTGGVTKGQLKEKKKQEEAVGLTITPPPTQTP